MKTGKLPETQQFYIRSMGKLLRVTSLFLDIDEANNYMERHPHEGVVAEPNGLIVLALMADRGRTTPNEEAKQADAEFQSATA